MKKFLLTLLLMTLTAALVFIGAVVYSYYTAEESLVPQTEISAGGKSILPDSYDYRVSLLSGLTHRNFEKAYEGDCIDLGKTSEPKLPLKIPDGYTTQVTVRKGNPADKDHTVFEGSQEEYRNLTLAESGSYVLDVTLAKPKVMSESYGQYHYRMSFQVVLPIKLVHSKPEVVQGDVFAISLENVPEGAAPTAQSDVSMVTFAKDGDKQVAYVPVAYTREPGQYSVTVHCGEFTQTVPFEVVDGTFEEQHMTINTSDPVISEANSPAAYQEYRDAIYPLYEQADDQIYWTGTFIQPLEEYRVSTPYGIKRFTNGSKKATRHAGVDMAAATGTPVKAPAAGRVVFAKRLLNTGNTVVIEHGAGLKTFYFHMDSLQVAAEEQVEQGQLIGEVGTTGYSTGPHLHFEMRMANQAIDPGYLMNGSGGFFSLPD